jgi:hypothetical protein
MCSDSTKVTANTNDVVNDFVKQNKMFTAYDVTKEVRNRLGPNIEVGHNVVRDRVHILYMLFGVGTFNKYHMSETKFPNGNVAILYHPSYTNPADYQKPVGVVNNVGKDNVQVVKIVFKG